MQDAIKEAGGAATSAEGHEGSGDSGKGNGSGKETAIITVNGKKVSIHRGRQTVAQIKTAGHVPLADDLEQQIDKHLVPLADDASVTIRGDEVFVSHPKDSASSHDALFTATPSRALKRK
jgi:hypothetical protein